MRVLLASTSEIKLRALRRVWPQAQGVPSSAATPAQPINSGLLCAHRRLDALIGSNAKADLYVAIENGIDTIDYLNHGGGPEHFVDVCYVVAERGGQRYEAASLGVPIEKRIVAQARAETAPNYAQRELGYQVTAGELLARRDGCAADNWMADPRHGAVDRGTQILNALDQLTRALE